ncbi:hypothetical protein BDV09DRAFT_201630 [Aspergillus tetrazonus]
MNITRLLHNVLKEIWRHLDHLINNAGTHFPQTAVDLGLNLGLKFLRVPWIGYLPIKAVIVDIRYQGNANVSVTDIVAAASRSEAWNGAMSKHGGINDSSKAKQWMFRQTSD